ncbi:helix-turn-helix domain-containing protein [Nocardia sp. NPDC050193]
MYAAAGSGSGSCTKRSPPPPPGGRLVFHVFAAPAEFIRELIVDGTHEGLAAARARGQRLGRPPATSEEQTRQARALLARPDESVSSIARLLARTTLYRYMPDPGRLMSGQRTDPRRMVMQRAEG